MTETPTQDHAASAPATADTVATVVVRDLFGNPLPPEEIGGPGAGAKDAATRDRKANSAAQKLLRMIKQRVEEMRLHTMTGLVSDEAQDKDHAIMRVATISHDLSKLILDLGDSV